jgi:hypothetical protein
MPLAPLELSTLLGRKIIAVRIQQNTHGDNFL